jgi:adenine-specific DNA-methyltransferase
MDLGQYFTRDEGLRHFVYDNVRWKGHPLLEPSFGAGHLLKLFLESDPHYPMRCHELDQTIHPVVELKTPHQEVVWGDFLSADIPHKFKTIVGNPPFVKTGGTNLYIEFIRKCLTHLDTQNGEMIFIVPSDLLRATAARGVLKTMMERGTMTHVLLPHNERLFEGASVDVVVFRYEVGNLDRVVEVNGDPKRLRVSPDGAVSFVDPDAPEGTPVSEMFHVKVGCVSGMDGVFRNPMGNEEFVAGEGTTVKFIVPTTFPTGDADVDAHLTEHRNALMGRKIRKFGEHNWWEWGAMRNVEFVRQNMGEPCIYVKTVTRQPKVAWVGRVGWFGGSLLCMRPTGEGVDIEGVAGFMNSDEFRQRNTWAGRFKMNQSQLLHALII